MSNAANDLTIYDAAADDWWSGRVPWVRTLHAMVDGRLGYFERLTDFADKRVLDLGCAGGFMAEALAKRGARVVGLDPAARAIAAARAHAARQNLEIDYDVGVGEALPYADAAFDIVVCVDVLEHVSDLEKVVTEIARVLKPGGLFLFDTINRNPLAAFLVVTVAERLLRLLPRGAHDPKLFIRPGALRATLARSGFDVGRFTGLGPRGVDRRGRLVFGRLPGTFVIYMGSARRAGGETDDDA